MVAFPRCVSSRLDLLNENPTSDLLAPCVPPAWKASQYLASAIESSELQLVASPELDQIYNPSPPPPSSAPGQGPPLLLTVDRVPEIVRAFGMNEEEEKELVRAVGQSEQRAKQTQDSRRDEHAASAKGKKGQDPIVETVQEKVEETTAGR